MCLLDLAVSCHVAVIEAHPLLYLLAEEEDDQTEKWKNDDNNLGSNKASLVPPRNPLIVDNVAQEKVYFQPINS